MFKYFAGVFAAIAGLAMGSQVHASTTALVNRSIGGSGTGACVDMSSMMQVGCNGSLAQQWNLQVMDFATDGAPIAVFKSDVTGQCLTAVPTTGAELVAPPIMAPCDWSESQRWKIDSPRQDTPSGVSLVVSRQIRNVGQSNICMDGANLHSTPGYFTEKTCDSTKSSQFWLLDVF